MLDDITTTIKAQLYERVTSPLLGSFLISWCLINYKLILILFSSLSAPEKITYIEFNLFSSVQDYMLKGVFFPLIATLAIILVYPYPAAKIYEISRNNRKKLKEIQQKIDDETPITRDEARKIRKAAVQIQIDFEEQTKRKDSEIEFLKSSVLQLTEESKTVIPREKDLTARILELETMSALQRSDITQLTSANEKYKEYIDTTLRFTPQNNYGSPDKKTHASSESTNTKNNKTNSTPHETLILKIKEYLKDTNIFQNQDTKIKAINNQIILEYPHQGMIESYKLGEMDPANFAKSLMEMMDNAKSVWNNRVR
ncbi:hypothetical protein HDC30_001637 [Pseudomonas sp. JAI115]|uniref:hypothetical protein n=1 Tax=Pseudomonas sp. JAI115 TaxID=2723061 RepID=UPI0016167AC7|nr:hypothetical protein [Pseudomonas sp. JAI115]MBB6154429.1 hypothetical protein [Pseudomonas sp. JAI115]